MTGSLAFRKNEAAIRRGDVPTKYTRLLPHIPRGRILEIGSAEGVLALLLARRGDDVIALERDGDRHVEAIRLRENWHDRFRLLGVVSFQHGPIEDRLDLFDRADVLVAVRMIYYLGDLLDHVFAAAAEKVKTVVLCGNGNRARRWREGVVEETKANNYYASREGMVDLLTRHGFNAEVVATDGDEIVVGRRA